MNRLRARLDSLGLLSRAGEVSNALVYEVVFAVSLAVIFPLTLRGLGPTDYGSYATMYAIAGFAITWVFAGTGQSVVQLIVQRHRDPRSVVSTARRQVAVVALPAGLVGLALTRLILGQDLLGPALILFGSDLLIAGIAEVHLAAVYSTLGVAASVRIRAVGPIVRAVGVASLFAVNAITVTSLILVNLAATVAILATALVVSRSALGQPTESTGSSTSRREVRNLSTMFSTSMSTNAVQNEGEKFILASFRPLSEVGEYQAAYRVVGVTLIPLNAVYVAANRWFLARHDRAGGQVRRSALLSIPLLCYGLACALAIVIGQPIIEWLVGPEFEAAATITLWLAAVPLLHALADVPPLGLIGLGENRLRMYLGFCTSAVALLAYLALIPHIGWKGAVIGTYVSELATIGGGWFLLRRCQDRHDNEQHGSET
jgi:O-antigen/teichoic acid export membrane protein